MYPISNQNGKRFYDPSQKRATSVYTALSTVGQTAFPLEIRTCNDLLSLQNGKKYLLKNNLSCNLNQPLNPLSNTIIKGKQYTIQFNMNRNGTVALFQRLTNTRFDNLLLKGTINGKYKCAAFAVESSAPVKFIKCKAEMNIQCENDVTSGAVAGGFVATIVNPIISTGKSLFKYSISKSKIKIKQNGVVISRVGKN